MILINKVYLFSGVHYILEKGWFEWMNLILLSNSNDIETASLTNQEVMM